jgi:hypothetical protein
MLLGSEELLPFHQNPWGRGMVVSAAEVPVDLGVGDLISALKLRYGQSVRSFFTSHLQQGRQSIN